MLSFTRSCDSESTDVDCGTKLHFGYRYVHNSPTNYTDPSGLQGEGAFGWVGYTHQAFHPPSPADKEKWERYAGYSAAAVSTAGLGIAAGEATAGVGVWVGSIGARTYVIGTLTAAQMQLLIASSGDRVVTVFSRLTQSPATNRLLHTWQNPAMCDKVRQGTTYVGRIPADLFARLKAENLIKVQKIEMGGVVEEAYVFEAEVMPYLYQYFQASGRTATQ